MYGRDGDTYHVGVSLLRWKSIPLRRNPCVASAVDLLQRFAIICSLNPFTGRVCFNTPPVVPVTLVPWKVCRSTLENVCCDPEGEAMSSSSQVYNAGTLRSLLREEEPDWYAVHTYPRHERVVAERIRQQGLTTFLPIITETHRWSDRRKVVELPLFSCYVFVQLVPTNEKRLCILPCAQNVRSPLSASRSRRRHFGSDYTLMVPPNGAISKVRACWNMHFVGSCDYSVIPIAWGEHIQQQGEPWNTDKASVID